MPLIYLLYFVNQTADSTLRVEGLECWRGENLLFDNLSFRVEPGDLVQITGANGSGKTTMLRMLCGLGLPDEGEVYWNDEPIRKVRTEFFSDLAYVGHLDGVKGDLTPVENLNLVQSLQGATDMEPVVALETLGLKNREDVVCRKLSAGQRRRVGLARLLMRPATLWVLDEPLTALDVKGRQTVEELLQAHAAKRGMVVFTSHHGFEMEGVRTVNLGD